MSRILVALVALGAGALIIRPSWPLALVLIALLVLAIVYEVVAYLSSRDKQIDGALRKRIEEQGTAIDELRRLLYSAKPGR